MTAGNGPTAREFGELRSDVTHVIEILARIEAKQDLDHDVCQDYRTWKPEHEKVHEEHGRAHARERGVFGMLIAAAAGLGSVFGFKP